MIERMMTVLVDTREQDPWTFARWRCLRRVRGLATGDYSVAGLTSSLRVERKSVADLFGSMTSGRDRFLRELDRMARFRHSFLVVEGMPELVERGTRWSRVDPRRMVESVFRECMARAVGPVFCPGRLEAEDMAYRLLRGAWMAKKAGGG